MQPVPKNSPDASVNQLDLLYRRFPHAIGSGMLLSALAVAALWQTVPHAALLSWMALKWGILLLSGLQTWRYLSLDPERVVSADWQRIAAITTTLSGFGWGAMAVWLPQSLSDPVMLFVIFILAGVTSYSATWLAAFPWAAFGFHAAALLPLAWRFASGGEWLYGFMAVIVVFYLVTMMGLGSHLREVMNALFRANNDNRRLNVALAQIQMLERDNALFRHMIEGTNDPAIFVTRPEDKGYFYYVNEAVCRHFGVSREEVMKWHVSDWDPHYAEDRAQQFWTLLEQTPGKSLRFESEHILGSGVLVPVEITLNLVECLGEPCIVGYFRNIAQQKAEAARVRQLEIEAMQRENERGFREVFDQFEEGIFLLDAAGGNDFTVVALNPAVERMIDVSDRSARGKLADAVFPEPFAGHLKKWSSQSAETGRPVRYEETLHVPTGKRLLAVSLVPLRDAAGKIYRMAGVVSDVTAQKEVERVLRERAEIEQRLSALVGSAPGFFYTLAEAEDGSFSMPFASSGIQDLYGLPPEAVSRDTAPLYARIYPDDLEHLQRLARISGHDGTLLQAEFRVRHPEKGDIWVETRAMPERMADGRLVLQGFSHEITARKQIEEQLRLKEFVLDSARDAVYLVGDDGYFTYVNQAACCSLGYSREELLRMSPFDIDPDCTPQALQEIEEQTLVSSNNAYVFERRHQRRDGSTFPVEITAFTEIFEGRALGITVVRDITQRKQAEAALLASQASAQAHSALLNAIMDSSPEVIVFALDRHYCYLAFNRRHQEIMQAIWGQSIEVGMCMLDVIGREDDRRKAQQAYDRALSGECFVEESAYGDEALKREYWQTIWSPIRVGSGEVNGLTCFVMNYTQRKQTESELHLKELALDSARDAICIVGEGMRFIYANEAACRASGYSREEMLRMTPADLDPDLTPEAFSELDAKLRMDGHATFESRHRRSDGSVYPVEVNVAMVDFDGRMLGISVERDISERKRLESKANDERARLRGFFSAMPDLAWIKDLEGRYLACNPVFEKLYGTSEAQILGKTDYDFVEAQQAEFFRRKDAEALAADAPCVNEEWVTFAADGRRALIETTKMPLRDAQGRIVGVLGIAHDITERSQTAEELARSNTFMNKVVDTIGDAIFVKDRQHRWIVLNNACCALIGHAREELLGKSDFDYFPEEIARGYWEADELVFASGEPDVREETILDPQGNISAIITSKYPFTDAAGQQFIVASIRDITQRKRAEETVRELNAELTATLQAIPDIMFELDQEGRYCNVWLQDAAVLVEMREALIGKTILEVLGPEADVLAKAIMREAEEQGFSSGHAFRMMEPRGERWYEYSASVKRVTGSDERRYVMLARDITGRKQIEQALAEREREFRTLVEHSPDTIARYDRDCRRTYVNPRFAAMAGDGAQLLGKTPAEFPGGEQSAVYEEKIREVFASGNDVEFELTWRGNAEQEICSLIHLTAERDPSGEIVSVLGVGRDITELNEYRQRIHALAFYDTLTELPNRALFNDRMRLMLADAERHGSLAAVMLLDLDRFKEINDTLGHTAGDELLREAGLRLMHCVRNYDTVARLGGDEFAVLLPQVRMASDLTSIAGKILGAFASPFHLSNQEVFVSTSIGIALYPDDSIDANDLVKFADSAMYHAKRSGRNNFRFYSKELGASATERLALESDLRKALARGELQLHYQPKLGLAHAELVGCEALLRWQHPVRGAVPPDRFIGIAEDSGLIIEIGEWVLRTACQAACRWNAEGRPLHKVAVNLSARQFQSHDLVATVRSALTDTGCRAEWIELEITESLLLDGHAEILEALQAFRDMGITIAIDDFGTGYSALSYLTRFPIHTLKIDRSFIRRVDTGDQHAELVKAIVSLARCLNLEVVAEGVETGEQADFLKACGCQMVQGYWFGKPMPENEFKYFLTAPFCEAG